ncbi:hypothetical protein WJX81_004858 [Elliptochloris bilobata]|uniref:HTH HARE-type domain-containing protein n=1 Tax=Elliptochloris bilobata TaxID=381761 RepID=A0AAW1S0U9_9CHLO
MTKATRLASAGQEFGFSRDFGHETCAPPAAEDEPASTPVGCGGLPQPAVARSGAELALPIGMALDSGMGVAYRVLAQTNQCLSGEEILWRVQEEGIRQACGVTPFASLCAALNTDIRNKGSASVLTRPEPNTRNLMARLAGSHAFSKAFVAELASGNAASRGVMTELAGSAVFAGALAAHLARGAPSGRVVLDALAGNPTIVRAVARELTCGNPRSRAFTEQLAGSEELLGRLASPAFVDRVAVPVFKQLTACPPFARNVAAALGAPGALPGAPAAEASGLAGVAAAGPSAPAVLARRAAWPRAPAVLSRTRVLK